MQTPCPLIGLFKLFRTKPSSIVLKSLTNTRWCQGTKLAWLFPYVGWYPCRLFILHSKSTSSRCSKHSKLAIKRRTKKIMLHLSIRKGKRNSKSNTCLLGVDIGCLIMKDLILSCLPILTSNLFPCACFLCGMGIPSCKLGCLTLTVYMMMSLSCTSLLIPLSLTPFMDLLSSSLPWQVC